MYFMVFSFGCGVRFDPLTEDVERGTLRSTFGGRIF